MHCKLTYNFIFSKSEKLRFLIDIILLIFWPLMDCETVKIDRKVGRERGGSDSNSGYSPLAMWHVAGSPTELNCHQSWSFLKSFEGTKYKLFISWRQTRPYFSKGMENYNINYCQVACLATTWWATQKFNTCIIAVKYKIR